MLAASRLPPYTPGTMSMETKESFHGFYSE